MCRVLLIAASRRDHFGSTCFLLSGGSATGRRWWTGRWARRVPELPGIREPRWCRVVRRAEGPCRTLDDALPGRGTPVEDATTLPDRGGDAADRVRAPHPQPRHAVIRWTVPEHGSQHTSAWDWLSGWHPGSTNGPT